MKVILNDSKKENIDRSVTDIIQMAQSQYPVNLILRGWISEEEMEELDKVCDVSCPSIYMDGTATYYIRYRNSPL